MAIKYVEVDGLGKIRLQKRRDTRNLRIALTPDGEVRVSLPAWAPYRLGIEFAQHRQTWVIKHRRPATVLKHGQLIGKSHRLQFISNAKTSRPSARLIAQQIRITIPAILQPDDPNVQQAAFRGSLKALQHEAKALLPPRLEVLARKHGFSYKNVQVKQLRSKWGSCNHRAEITLNVFLMTLPWQLIDYVLLHELVHTKVLRHGEPFWNEMQQHLPNAKILRKEMRQYQPAFQIPNF